MSLGQIIKKKREQLNLTLDEVSSRVGFSKPYLSTIETGKVKKPAQQLPQAKGPAGDVSHTAIKGNNNDWRK